MARWAGMAVCALLACCNTASALNPSLDVNQYAHTAWTVRSGFFKGVINSIAQTPDGYLWLGTEFGLIRFDGVRSVPWQPPPGEKLPGTVIRVLLAARDGRLWIGTDDGLASWKDGKLTHYQTLAGQFVESLHEDREGTMWVGGAAPSGGKLCAIETSSVRCDGQDGRFGRAVVSFFEGSDGVLWVGAANGLWRWKPGPPKLYSTRDAASTGGLIEGPDHALLVATGGQILQLAAGKLRAYRLPELEGQLGATEMLRDRNGGLWIGTASRGLLHVRAGRDDVFALSDGLSGDDVTAFYEDHEGSIWVATTGGLDRFRDFMVPTLSAQQGLSSPAAVWSVLATRDNSIWIGTRNGLNRWHDGQITIYRNRSGGLDDADSLFQDDRGQIWISTLRGVAHLENGRFIPAVGVAPGVVRSIAEDEAGNLWIGHQDQGLLRMLEGRVVEQIPWVKLGHKDFATALLPDTVQGGLWIGFFQGGVAYFRDGQVRASFSNAEGLGEGRVDDLRFDSEGAIWVATEGGLSRLKNGRVATLSSKNGLPCDEVHWAVEGDGHSYWLYTACGLVRIATSELNAWVADSRRPIHVTVFDSSDGVRSRVGSFGFSPTVARSADGKLWFLPYDGVSVVDPRHLAFNKLPPPVQVEQITADRKTYDASSNQRLPPLVRDLEIDYTALSLVAPEKNRFRVKLEGRDPDWKDVGTERKAFYNDLPPRNYRFRVMASNNSGVWNEAGAAFDFSIAPTYYQTRWFQALCIAASLGLLWALYRFRLHQIAREFNVRMEERVGERTRLARDLHDTLLQGLQGLMLRLQALDDLLPQGEAKDELEQTLDRADQVVAEGRKAVHDLRLSTVVSNDLARAVKAMGDELSSENSGNPTTFGLLVEGQVEELHPIVRDEVYRITREALRNAFSHARAHHIEAEIIYAEDLFRLRIRDDGKGIAPAILEEGRPGHYGLPGMRERATGIGAKLDIWSGAGSGTEVDLSLAGSIAYGKRPDRSRLRMFREKAE